MTIVRRQSSKYPPDSWGMVVDPQGGKADGQHKAQPLLESWRWVRAQIGARPVQITPRGDAGQSSGQVSGTIRGDIPSIGGVRRWVDRQRFDNGPEIIHIQRFFRAANTGYSGTNHRGRSAYWGGITSPGGSLIGGTGDNFTVIKRGVMRYPTRGPRSVSGANNRKARFDDVGRVPSVFVPTTPLR